MVQYDWGLGGGRSPWLAGVAALSVQFPDSLFQLGEFADLCDLFACYGELVSLFGRTGNFAASHWPCSPDVAPSTGDLRKYAVDFAVFQPAEALASPAAAQDLGGERAVDRAQQPQRLAVEFLDRGPRRRDAAFDAMHQEIDQPVVDLELAVGEQLDQHRRQQ